MRLSPSACGCLRNLAFTTPRYWHERAGFNFRMTGFQAAFGVAQLKKIDAIIEKKRSVAQRYSRALAGVPGLQLPAEKDWAFNVYWMYALTVGPEYRADAQPARRASARPGASIRARSSVR